ncbi:MAG: glutamate--tRNA ligase [Planctomycetota bacterium]
MADMVITRFAPSPTGHLHIGGARTALFCWAAARRAQAGGDASAFLLRIEDTDAARSSTEAAKGILEDLAWLGVVWDEGPETHGMGGDPRGAGPFYQSERRGIYDEHLAKLIDAGIAFPAFESPHELTAMRKSAEAQKRTFIYRRPEGYDHAAALERARAEPHVIRLRMPEAPVVVHDEVLGEVTFPYEELDDFVVRKADGMPTYHFAVVVDDALMGVTHVLRGQEHLNNAPKHVALQAALGLPTPTYAHMPLIFNIDGTKMSKRDKDKAAKKAVRASTDAETSPAVLKIIDSIGRDTFDAWLGDKSRQLPRDQLSGLAGAMGLRLPEIDVEDFREAGYLPGVICNFIALLGWNPKAKNDDGTDRERFDMAYLAEHFDLPGIGKTNAKFDREKLLAFNADTIQHGMTDEAFAETWLSWLRRFDPALAAFADEDPARWHVASAASRPRAKTLRDARDALGFVFADREHIEYAPKAVKKFLLKGEPSGLDALAQTRAVLADASEWTAGTLEHLLTTHADTTGLGMGKVAQPLRIAITGTAVSPPLGQTLALLPRAEALARIDRCLAHDHTQRVAPA